MNKNTKAIEIEKGVPIPPSISPATAYPFMDMQVGDSFFAEGKTYGNLYPQMRMARTLQNSRYISRYSVELNGVRVWRVA